MQDGNGEVPSMQIFQENAINYNLYNTNIDHAITILSKNYENELK